MAAGRELPELEPVTVSARSVHAAELEPAPAPARRRGRRRDDAPEQLTMRRLRGAPD